MKFAVAVPNTGEYADIKLLVELAQEAKSAGWDGFFIWDTLYSMTVGHACGVTITNNRQATLIRALRGNPDLHVVDQKRPWVSQRRF